MARGGRGFPLHTIVASTQKAAVQRPPPAVVSVPERTLMGVGV